jgi:predicted dehydrogenase
LTTLDARRSRGLVRVLRILVPALVSTWLAPAAAGSALCDVAAAHAGVESRSGRLTETQAELGRQAADPAFRSARPTLHAAEPPEMRGRHRGKHVVILGSESDLGRGLSGWVKVVDIVKDLVGPETGIHIYDPKLQQPGGARPQYNETVLASLSDIPPDSIVIQLTPNKYHVPMMEELAKNPNVTGIYTEKPIGLDSSQMRRVKAVADTAGKTMVLGDHELFVMPALYKAMGLKVPGHEYVDISSVPPGPFREALEAGRPLLGEIKHVKGVHHELGNIEGRQGLRTRGEGGVMLDLYVHFLNGLGVLGMKPVRYSSVRLKQADRVDGRTELKPMPREGAAAEDYANLKGRMSNGATFEFDVQQFAEARESRLELTDVLGRRLVLHRDSHTVEVFDGDLLVGTLRHDVNVYWGMMDYALSYMGRRSGGTMFLPEQTDAISAIEAANAAYTPPE